MSESIVDILNLDFVYPQRETLVLKQVSLKIERGTTVGLIGPNGGGKTTLVKLLLGLARATRGTITIEGMPPEQAVRRGDIVGYLPQNPAVPTRFPIDVRQVVRLGLAGKTGMLRSTRRDDIGFVESLLERLGIRELASAPINSLSGGQLQRVLIARALAPRPKLLVLDEPTTGIDRLGQQRFIQSLNELKAELGLTVLLVSHDLRAVSAISERIACLNVTLHYHDAPEHLPADLVYRLFACDLEAFGLGHSCGSISNKDAPGTYTTDASLLPPRVDKG
ncbi:MAG: ABC transporter ATP-binding protein [Chthoniobacterales bacterium]|nr:ABC transporter ATP-binding protein [Chthoniobacterales bacterium]